MTGSQDDARFHSSAYHALVEEARGRVREFTVPEYRDRLARGERWVLVDIREDHEWQAGRIPGALHIGRGILEREIEKAFPDRETPLVLQCGGGFRSALSADSLQRMGYTNVVSLDGGIRDWAARGLPIETE